MRKPLFVLALLAVPAHAQTDPVAAVSEARLRADVERLARRLAPADVLRVCDVITTTRRRLTQNAALPLALEAMTVRLGDPAA